MSSHNLIQEMNEAQNAQGKVFSVTQSAPSNGSSGYSKGALWVDSASGALHVNSGTTSGSVWSMISPSGVASVYGSALPGKFLRDAFAGTDSIDIVVVGDSNTGSAAADMWGFHNGMQKALHSMGCRMYATPVLPVVTGITSGTSNATPHTWRSQNTMWSGIAANDPLLDGNASGGSTPYAGWTPTASWTRYGSSTASPPYIESWAYIASSAGPNYWFSTDGVSIDPNHPLNQNGQTVTYRVRYGKFNTGSGQFTPIVLNATTSALASARVLVSTSGGNGLLDSAVAERTFSPNGIDPFRGGWAYTGPAGSPADAVKGPIAIFAHSMYRTGRGFAVTSHGYQGGETSTQIAQKMSNLNKSLVEHLIELRQRQIAGGGTGRVLVFVHAGTNGNEEGAQWVAAMNAIWASYKGAWQSVGYPLSDLAILCVPSHPFTEDDTSNGGDVASPRNTGNLGRIRAAAKAMVVSDPTMATIDVTQLLPYRELDSGNTLLGAPSSYWQVNSAGAIVTKAHLSGGFTGIGTWSPTDGYANLSSLMFGALIGRD